MFSLKKLLIICNYLLVWTRTDNITLQGSMTLIEGSDIHFVTTAKNVSNPRHHRFSVKLLKVELDYRIIDKYRFFVPKLQENTLCQCQCSKDTGVQGLSQSALVPTCRYYVYHSSEIRGLCLMK